MRNKVSITTKLWLLILSLMVSSALFLSVSTVGNTTKEAFLSSSFSEGVYVIENLNVDYRYDKTKYEVVNLSSEPYAVIRGDKALINMLKWSGNPEFFIELSGKPPGTYRETIQYSGINKGLTVEIYPSILDLRLMEQQTIKIVPTIEVVGQDKLKENYIVSLPELDKEEVMIRDIQDKLNLVGQVKGVIDVSNMIKTQTVTVTLEVYDRDGSIIPNINLIDKTIQVTIPIEKKVTIVKEEIVNEIVVIEKEDSKETDTSKQNETQSKEPSKQPEKDTPVKEGVLSFINIPEGLNLVYDTSNLKWSGDVKIDLKGFKAGKYEMTVNDNGVKKVVKFTLTEKDKPKEPNDKESEESDELISTPDNEEEKDTLDSDADKDSGRRKN